MKKVTQILILLIALATLVAGAALARTSNGNNTDVGFQDLLMDSTMMARTSNGNNADVG